VKIHYYPSIDHLTRPLLTPVNPPVGAIFIYIAGDMILKKITWWSQKYRKLEKKSPII